MNKNISKFGEIFIDYLETLKKYVPINFIELRKIISNFEGKSIKNFKIK